MPISSWRGLMVRGRHNFYVTLWHGIPPCSHQELRRRIRKWVPWTCSRMMLSFLSLLSRGMRSVLRIAVSTEICFLLKACHARPAERRNASRLRRDAARIGLLVPPGLHCSVRPRPAFLIETLMSHGQRSARGE